MTKRYAMGVLARLGGAAMALAGPTVVAVPMAGPGIAQEVRSPFGDGSDMGFPVRPAPKRQPAPVLPPMDGTFAPDRAPTSGLGDAPPIPASASSAPMPASTGGIERSELAPLDGSTATVVEGNRRPAGPDAAQIEAMLSGLDLSSRSPALSGLLRRVFTSSALADDTAALALRLEALYRMGALEDSLPLANATAEDPVLATLTARIQIAVGSHEVGCHAARLASGAIARLPESLAGELIALQGFCAAVGGNHAAAGLSAALARERNGTPATTLALLDALAAGAPAPILEAKRLSALDYRLLRLGPTPDIGAVIQRAEPALLAALAADSTLETVQRIRAAEASAAAGVIPAATLASAWRSAPAVSDPLDQASGRIDPHLRRGALLRAVETERTPSRKARLVRALLEEARRAGVYHQALPLLSRPVESLPAVAEIGWFAETAIEVLVGAGQYGKARAWVKFAGTLDRQDGSMTHWLALIDIAEPSTPTQRGDTLGSVEELALRGRFNADVLHRLASVLDALDYNVPVRLWEAASRTPQPSGGYLPETGVLAELQAASRRSDGVSTAVLALRSLGPGGADQANILALGDVIRGLRRAGFEAEARRLAYEALIVSWPRQTSN